MLAEGGTSIASSSASVTKCAATPAGPVAPTGAKVSIPTADFFYLRDGKIEMFNCYVSMNTMLAQMGIYPDFATAVKLKAAAG